MPPLRGLINPWFSFGYNNIIPSGLTFFLIEIENIYINMNVLIYFIRRSCFFM